MNITRRQVLGGAALALVPAQPGPRFACGTASGAVHPGGRVGTATDVRRHGTASHAHQVVVDPTGAYVLAVDLGLDAVIGYTLAGGRLTEAFRTPVRAGSRPRHLAFHPGGKVAYAAPDCGGVWPRHLALDPSGTRLYVANQRSGTVTWLPVDRATGVPGAPAGSLPVPGVAHILF